MSALNETAVPPMFARGRRRHDIIQILLLVTFCLSTVLSVISIWMRIQINDTDRYVRTVAPLASDPALQDAVASTVSTRLEGWLNEHVSTRDLLIDRQQALAAPLTAALVDYVDKTVRDYVASDQFRQQWENINRAAHPAVSAVLTGGDTQFLAVDKGQISLDIAPIIDAVLKRLQEQGVDVFSGLNIDQMDTTFVIFESDDLADIQSLVDRIESLAIVLPLLALATLGAYLYFATQRRQAVISAGVGLATAMAISLTLFALARWRILDQLGPNSNKDAVASFFNIIARYPRRAARLLAAFGLAVAFGAAITRPESRARHAPAAAGSWMRTNWDSAQVRWPWLQPTRPSAARHRGSLVIALLAICSLILIFNERVTSGPVLTALVILVVGLAVIIFMPGAAPQIEPAGLKVAASVPAAAAPPITQRPREAEPELPTPPTDGAPQAGEPGMRGPVITISLELPDEDARILRRIAVLLRDTS